MIHLTAYETDGYARTGIDLKMYTKEDFSHSLALELTAHSAGFVVLPGLGCCGPQLSGSVRLPLHEAGGKDYRKRVWCKVDNSTFIWR